MQGTAEPLMHCFLSWMYVRYLWTSIGYWTEYSTQRGKKKKRQKKGKEEPKNEADLQILDPIAIAVGPYDIVLYIITNQQYSLIAGLGNHPNRARKLI